MRRALAVNVADMGLDEVRGFGWLKRDDADRAEQEATGEAVKEAGLEQAEHGTIS